jgi:ferredoxin-thioredoxin reductase catalytic chain
MSGGQERPEVTPEEVERLYRRLDAEAENAGYHLNPNKAFTRGLIEGMLVNERRYGYWACPCRLASGKKSEDLDIICPCDYRDADLAEYGACFCALYVSQEVVDGTRRVTRVPERRPREMSAEAETPAPAKEPAQAAGAAPGGSLPARGQPAAQKEAAPASGLPNPTGLKYPVWRCKVCGYLCARDGPPEVCPICKAKKERFERFL